jgi:hypothetical protein
MDETKVDFPIGPGPITQLRHRARTVLAGENPEDITTVTNAQVQGCEYGLVTRNIPYVSNLTPIFNSITNVIINQTVLVSYIVPSNAIFNFTGFNVSGDLPALYQVISYDLASSPTKLFSVRTNASNLNHNIQFTVPVLRLPQGYQLKITCSLLSTYGGNPPAANYEATMLGFENSTI